MGWTSELTEQRHLVGKFVKHFNNYWLTGNATLVASLYDEFISFVNHADNSVTYGRESKKLHSQMSNIY